MSARVKLHHGNFRGIISTRKNANRWIIARLGTNAMKLMTGDGWFTKELFKWSLKIERAGSSIVVESVCVLVLMWYGPVMFDS